MNSAWVQASGIAEPVGCPGKKPPLRQRCGIPYLLGHHAAWPGHRRHGFQIARRIISGHQFVVTALAGEKRPGAAAAGAVEWPPIGVFAVAVAVVAMPGSPVRRIDFEQDVGNRHGVADQGVVRTAQTEAHEPKEIDADLLIDPTLRRFFGSSNRECCSTTPDHRAPRPAPNDVVTLPPAAARAA